MAITYTWSVVQMDCYPTQPQPDCVFTVHWTLNGTDGTYNGSLYGAVGVTYNPDEPYIPYAQLTQTEVIGWVEEALGTEQIASFEANIANQIADQINPPVVTPPLPWAQPAPIAPAKA
jgi:hypothetical protein